MEFDCKLSLNENLDSIINPVLDGLIFYISLLSYKQQMVWGYEDETWPAGIPTLVFPCEAGEVRIFCGCHEAFNSS